MNKLIPKCQQNSGNAFGRISYFNTSGLYDWGYKRREDERIFKETVVDPTINKVKEAVKTSNSRVLHKNAVRAKQLGKPGYGVSTATNDQIALQEALYNGGFAPKDMAYEKFVDGCIEGNNLGSITLAAFDKAVAAGYDSDLLKKGKLVKKLTNNTKNTRTTPSAWQHVHHNLYPYGYGDSMLSKFMKGISEKDPRRAAFDEFKDLDLSTIAGRNRAAELRPLFSNFVRDSNEIMLQSFRYRDDIMNMFDGNTPKYGMYTINTLYSSPSATDGKTYVYADESARARDLQAALYFLNHNRFTGDPSTLLTNEEDSEGTLRIHRSKDGKSIIYNVTGDPYSTKGDYSIVTDADGKNARMVDIWDYKFDIPMSNPVVVGDTIPSSGPGIYGGVHFTKEQDDDKNVFSKGNDNIIDYIRGYFTS